MVCEARTCLYTKDVASVPREKQGVLVPVLSKSVLFGLYIKRICMIGSTREQVSTSILPDSTVQ
jgi:hypothetical protein